MNTNEIQTLIKEHGRWDKTAWKAGKQLAAKRLKLSGMDLSEVDFRECVLAAVDFSGTNLCKAIFAKSHLFDCLFSDALMKGVDFSKAILDGSDLRGAKLENAVFQKTSNVDTDLRGIDVAALKIEPVRLEMARI